MSDPTETEPEPVEEPEECWRVIAKFVGFDTVGAIVARSELDGYPIERLIANKHLTPEGVN